LNIYTFLKKDLLWNILY